MSPFINPYVLVICSCFLVAVHGLPVFGNHGGFQNDIQQEVFQASGVHSDLTLNKALSMDSDEDLFFDQFWLEEDEDDAYEFVYNLFEENEGYTGEGTKPSIMLVSSLPSSPSDRIIELALMAKTKDTVMLVSSVEQVDDMNDLDMTSET